MPSMTRAMVAKSKPRPTPLPPKIERETLAEAIVKISSASERLLRSGLNANAIVTLLRAETGLPKKTIDSVLESLKQLSAKYCR